MKTLTIISTLSLVILLSSCNMNQAGKEPKPEVNVDSLALAWSDAWTNHDSAAIASMLSEDTRIIFSSSFSFIGRDSIIAKWVNPYLLSTGKISSNMLMKDATGDIACYAASYTREIIKNDTVKGQDKSTYSAVWKRHDDNTWKLEYMHFGSQEK